MNKEFLEQCFENNRKDYFGDFCKILYYAESDVQFISSAIIEQAYIFAQKNETLLCELFAFTICRYDKWDVFLKNFYELPSYIQDYIRDNYYIDTVSFPDDTLESIIEAMNWS